MLEATNVRQELQRLVHLGEPIASGCGSGHPDHHFSSLLHLSFRLCMPADSSAIKPAYMHSLGFAGNARTAVMRIVVVSSYSMLHPGLERQLCRELPVPGAQSGSGSMWHDTAHRKRDTRDSLTNSQCTGQTPSVAEI
jgi:hypothetical protein